MGVNYIITWAVIDQVMRAVITETRALSSRFVIEVTLEKRELQVLR